MHLSSLIQSSITAKVILDHRRWGITQECHGGAPLSVLMSSPPEPWPGHALCRVAPYTHAVLQHWWVRPHTIYLEVCVRIDDECSHSHRLCIIKKTCYFCITLFACNCTEWSLLSLVYLFCESWFPHAPWAFDACLLFEISTFSYSPLWVYRGGPRVQLQTWISGITTGIWVDVCPRRVPQGPSSQCHFNLLNVILGQCSLCRVESRCTFRNKPLNL